MVAYIVAAMANCNAVYITHKIAIRVRADQLVGSDPDREVELAELPNKPFTNSASCNHFA